MEETLVKGRQMQDDCFAVVKKLRAIIHSTEEQLRVPKKQTLFLTHLTTKTLPKGLHRLPLRLTTECINPVVWSSPKAPFSASRFLTGSGNERGAIAISLESSRRKGIIQTDDVNEERCGLRVDIFQVVTWYVKVYFHTTQLFVDEQAQTLGEFVEKMRVSPSEDKVSPSVMEMVLRLPCAVKSRNAT
ncbi:hypothetical protein AgCh_006689 [Apium graveolens]